MNAGELLIITAVLLVMPAMTIAEADTIIPVKFDTIYCDDGSKADGLGLVVGNRIRAVECSGWVWALCVSLFCALPRVIPAQVRWPTRPRVGFKS